MADLKSTLVPFDSKKPKKTTKRTTKKTTRASAQAPAASGTKTPKVPATPKPARNKPAATAFSEVDPNMKRTTIYLDDDVKKAFKIWCVTHDTTMTEWIAKTIVQHLKKEGVEGI